jgi:hypothetical protein
MEAESTASFVLFNTWCRFLVNPLQQNREKIIQRQRVYYLKSKEVRRLKQSENYQIHAESKKAKQSEIYHRNPEEKKQKQARIYDRSTK